MSTEAMTLALEALEGSTDKTLSIRAITALQKALAQPQQEPVAWMFQHEETGRTLCVDAQQVEWGFEKGNPRLKKIAPLYTSPPAQPQQEPVAWRWKRGDSCWQLEDVQPRSPTAQPLYTAPPAQRKPLTDEEVETVWRSVQANDFHDCVKPFARAIEAKHNIKGDA